MDYSQNQIKLYNETKYFFKNFRDTTKTIFNHIQCHRCGECCNFGKGGRGYAAIISPDEFRRFGNKICIYLKDEHIYGELGAIGLKHPCCFYDDINKKCTINNNKPFSCSTYPIELSKINTKKMIEIFPCPLGKDIVKKFREILNGIRYLDAIFIQKQQNFNKIADVFLSKNNVHDIISIDFELFMIFFDIISEN